GLWMRKGVKRRLKVGLYIVHKYLEVLVYDYKYGIYMEIFKLENAHTKGGFYFGYTFTLVKYKKTCLEQQRAYFKARGILSRMFF
ncbi:hypothetical protein ACJX0J_033544, partial [Zea mays]